MPYTPKNPSPATVKVNRESAARYDLDDRQDFADAGRGFIAGLPDGRTLGDDGRVIFDAGDYAYLTEDAPVPDSVNPSLWRQSQVMHEAGLYKVTDRLYQVRNLAIANLTIVEGDDGLVIIDTTQYVEGARQGLELFRRHVSDKPVVAVIYTHTHIDHYGGIKGVVDPADVASGKVPIVAPGTIESFDKYAIGENVIGGNAMSRRAGYAFCALLPKGPKGMVSNGIGLGGTRNDTISYLSPTDAITQTGQVRQLAGLTFEFLYAPDTEAPEEMHIWIPELRALTCAENANHSMHNIQTLRGARTRDARNFARYLDETLERWGDQAQVHYGPHTWPVFGNTEVVAFLESQRDTYKYIHDQAMRLANKGQSPIEAAEVVQLPDALGRKWFNRYYHGTLNHNVKAVFAKELGWWDGDPVSLYPLPPVESATRMVDLIGADRIMAEARRAYDAADYRWLVTLLHNLVFAQPDNQAARELQADAYEQLGYQAEGPQWRGIFLTAARELREGVITTGPSTVSEDTVLGMPVGLLLDYAAIHIIGEKAAGLDLRVNVEITDLGERWTFWVRNGVLNARMGAAADARLTVSGPKAAITGFLLKPAAARQLAQAGKLELKGDETVLDELAAVMDEFDPHFNMVTP